MNAWKVGARWGNCGESVLDRFLDYGIVFVGGTDETTKQGDYASVKPGDIFLISHGFNVVAVGVARSVFMHYSESDLPLKFDDQEKFFDHSVLVAKADIHILEEEDRLEYHEQKRFCRIKKTELKDAAIQLLLKYMDRKQHGEFEIFSRTVSLFAHQKKESIFSNQQRYCIPIYKRPYSWGATEITSLFKDIEGNFKHQESIFMGTIQLSAPIPLTEDGLLKRYDIIDGQQRLTTFLIIAIVLHKLYPEEKSTLDIENLRCSLRTLVNNGEAQKDFNAFLKSEIDNIREAKNSPNPYLRNACLILGILKSLFEEDPDGISLIPEAFCSFIIEKIRFVIIETHAELSKTLQIFNVINASGLDLNVADLFKVRFYEFLTTKCNADQSVFEDISSLYRDVEIRNKKKGCTVTSFTEILKMLKSMIIEKYELDNALFNYSAERFFEQLFDAILGINYAYHFTIPKIKVIINDDSEDAPLSVKGIKKLTDF